MKNLILKFLILNLFIFGGVITPKIKAQTWTLDAFTGTYSSSISYAKNNIVIYNNIVYISLVPQNLNNEPDTHPVSWQQIGATTAGSGAVSSVFGRTGIVTSQTGDYTVSQITGAAPIYSPTFTGTPVVPGYLTTAIAASTYQPLLGFTPYNATNPAGYITSAVTSLPSLSLPYTQLSGTVPTWNQSTTGNANTATNLAAYPAICTGGAFSQGLSSGSNNCATPAGGGSSVGTTGQLQMVGPTAGSFAASNATDNGTLFNVTEPFSLAPEYSNGTCTTAATLGTQNAQDVTLTDADTCAITFTQPATGVEHLTLKVIQSATSPYSGQISGSGVTWIGGSAPTIPATASAIVFLSCYLDGTNTYCDGRSAPTYGSCTEAWGGSGTSHALTAGDDAVVNNTCFNDSGVMRTITAVKCRNDAATNTTTIAPVMGAAGSGTSILSAALTCGSAYAYSASGVIGTSAWTTGTGINPVMGGTLTGTSVSMIVEYTY